MLHRRTKYRLISFVYRLWKWTFLLQYILLSSRGHFPRLKTAIDAHVTRFAQPMTWWKGMSPSLACDINHIMYFPLTFPGPSLSQVHARECPTRIVRVRVVPSSLNFVLRNYLSWAIRVLRRRRSFCKTAKAIHRISNGFRFYSIQSEISNNWLPYGCVLVTLAKSDLRQAAVF